MTPEQNAIVNRLIAAAQDFKTVHARGVAGNTVNEWLSRRKAAEIELDRAITAALNLD